MKKLLIFAIIILLLQTAGVRAISVQEGQETLNLAVESGETHLLFLIINSDGGENITSSGETESWVRLGAENTESVVFPASGTQYLRVNVTVPEGHEIGDYQGKILADGSALSTLIVTATLPVPEIEELQTLADVDSKISDLQSDLNSKMSELQTDVGSSLDDQLDEIQSRVDEIKTDLSKSIQDLKSYNEDVSSLESEKVELEKKIEGMNSELYLLENETQELYSQKSELEITGSILRGESQILFALGILIGAGGIFLFYKRLNRYFK